MSDQSLPQNAVIYNGQAIDPKYKWLLNRIELARQQQQRFPSLRSVYEREIESTQKLLEDMLAKGW